MNFVFETNDGEVRAPKFFYKISSLLGDYYNTFFVSDGNEEKEEKVKENEEADDELIRICVPNASTHHLCIIFEVVEKLRVSSPFLYQAAIERDVAQIEKLNSLPLWAKVRLRIIPADDLLAALNASTFLDVFVFTQLTLLFYSEKLVDTSSAEEFRALLFLDPPTYAKDDHPSLRKPKNPSLPWKQMLNNALSVIPSVSTHKITETFVPNTDRRRRRRGLPEKRHGNKQSFASSSSSATTSWRNSNADINDSSWRSVPPPLSMTGFENAEFGSPCFCDNAPFGAKSGFGRFRSSADGDKMPEVREDASYLRRRRGGGNGAPWRKRNARRNEK